MKEKQGIRCEGIESSMRFFTTQNNDGMKI
jgi:hypothetical protein